MSDSLTPITPFLLTGADLSPLGEVPKLVWLPISSLRINADYQRDLSRRSRSVILKVAREWDWARMKALSVCEVQEGVYEVLDGQHTATAAASRGDIEALPCLVTSREELAARAAAFVGINRDRVAMTSLQVFWADVAAGSEDACDALRGVELAGGRILRASPGAHGFRPGDVMSAVGIVSLAKRGGVAYVRRVVSIGVQGHLAPIHDVYLRAIASLIWDRKQPLSDETIIDVLRIHGGERLRNKASQIAKEERQKASDALAGIIRRLSK